MAGKRVLGAMACMALAIAMVAAMALPASAAVTSPQRSVHSYANRIHSIGSPKTYTMPNGDRLATRLMTTISPTTGRRYSYLLVAGTGIPGSGPFFLGDTGTSVGWSSLYKYKGYRADFYYHTTISLRDPGTGAVYSSPATVEARPASDPKRARLFR